jgi:hypothetical protein
VIAASVFALSVPAIALAQTDSEVRARDNEVVRDEIRPDHLERAKAGVINKVERRLRALGRLATKIDRAKHVTEAHAASLLDDISSAREALRSGIPTVQAVVSLEDLREVSPPVFESTLVFALLVPKSHDVAASDTVVAATARFTEFAGSLQETLNRLSGSDIDTTEAQANLDEVSRLVDTALAAGGPVADTVIGLQPADWPEPAQPGLREGRAALDQARSSLREARALAREVVEFIRATGTPSEG